MYYLWSDEAGDTQQGYQSIASLLVDTPGRDTIRDALDQELQKYNQTDLKFARVRTNATYVQHVNAFLTTFFANVQDVDMYLLLCSGKDESLLYADMYEEIFLLAQAKVDDEIVFCPDANNMMKRYEGVSKYKEYGITQIQEQDSKKSSIVQVMDIIAGIVNFLREHRGTYRARSQSDDRYEQMDDFDRELHLRCEVVEHFLGLMQQYFGETEVLESGLLMIDSERIIVLDY